jgi:peptidoglycan/xylan/chitin deacetylase (PgdA/CDA1 family)
VSFTFDDFPANAATQGASILESHSCRGTYYASLGLFGTNAPTGQIARAEDIQRLVNNGHDIGCHTFHHLDAWATDSKEFGESIQANAFAIQSILPQFRFTSLSYPISAPHPRNKHVASLAFEACRAGGQSINAGTIDLNALRSFFLEKAANCMTPIDAVIEANIQSRGWLIFSTHDISPTPTRFGCTPAFFEAIVARTLARGCRVLSVAEVLKCGAIAA